MIRRDINRLAVLLMLSLSAPAMAGTLYKCAGAPDQPTNYSSSPVPGMVCKAIGYKGGGASRGRSPVAFGSGSVALPGAASAPTGPAPDSPANGLAMSAPLPAVSTPAIAGSVAIPRMGGASLAVADAAPLSPAPLSPAGGQARISHKTLYRYTDANGLVHIEDEIHKPKQVLAQVVDQHTQTCKDAVHCQETGWMLGVGNYSETNNIGLCYACRVLPGVNFGTLALNTTAFALEIATAAHTYGVDEALVRAIIHAESDYNPNAVSYKGAQGLMQLMPGTASRFGVLNPFAAAQNINGGVQYLSFLSRRYNGDVRLVAAAYNSGEGNVDRYGGVPPFAETQRYVERVGTLAERYRSAK